MARSAANLGTKRQCQSCGAKFYDLGKRPVVCSRCGAEQDLARLKKAKVTETAGDDPQRATRPRPKPRRSKQEAATQAAPAADLPVRPARPGLPKNWSPEQTRALDAVAQWLRKGEPQVFRMFGYAGVGKTTLARHIAEGARGEEAFAAFTGKAALVLRSKGCVGATTIHSLIYRASEGVEGAPSFTLNHDGPASRAGLIVIDECSMVDEELGRDLISFGKPILVLGDPAQLPPVKGGGYFTEAEPDVMLTEIHRQAQDNPIIRLAAMVRAGGEIAYGEYGDARVIRRNQIEAPMVLAADQVLVGMNRTRRLYNQRIRALLDKAEAMPVVGDKLVCLRNDRTKGLINGGLWRVEGLGGVKKDYVKMTVRSEDEPSRSATKVAIHKAFFDGTEAELSWPVRRDSDEFDYGYALTVHKAQGSQWDDVMLFDESGAFREHRARWLYTGVTRAARRLTIVR